ncbi:TlpA family protein disulfide reductase [Chloroflexota bacterium]
MSVSVLLLGLLMGGCSGSTAAPVAGKPAPDFQLSTLDGQSVSLSDFQGNPVLLNFWATWCGPCRLEIPFLQLTYEEWADKGLVILAVDVGEKQSSVKEFIEQFGSTFPVLLDPRQEVALMYNIRALPTTFFIDANGKIQDIHVGAFPSTAAIERRLVKIIP